MNKRIKTLWVNALRSGEYSQGTEQLRDKYNNFCCLGVLCNIYAKEHPSVAARQTDTVKFMNNEAYLPYSIIKWAGLNKVSHKKTSGYDVRIEDDIIGTGTLSSLNDEGQSFEEIADIIERNL